LNRQVFSDQAEPAREIAKRPDPEGAGPMQSSADVRTGAGPRSGFIRGRPFTELPKALPIAIIDND